MKNYFYLLLLAISVLSCSKNSDENNLDETTDQEECSPVMDLLVSEITISSFSLEFSSGQNQFSVEYGEAGFIEGQGNLVQNYFGGSIEGDLKGSTNYEVYIKSTCPSGEVVKSSRRSFLTPPCPVPVISDAVNITNNSATLFWFDEPINYELEYGEEGFILGTGIVVLVNAENVSLYNLNSGSTYDAYLRSSCGGIPGDNSPKFTFTTDFNCNEPWSLQWTTVSDTYVDLYWQTNGESSWQIEYGLAGFEIGTGSILYTSVRPFRIQNLQGNTSYQFYVRAVCTEGGFSDYDSIIVTTL